MRARWAVRRSACECRRVQIIAGRGLRNHSKMRTEEQRRAVPSKGKYPEEAGPWPERTEIMRLDYKPIRLRKSNTL